jgi:hypothetical protein
MKPNGPNVYGCGLVIDPNDKLAVFFTLNGILMGNFSIGYFLNIVIININNLKGRQISICPSVDHLFPAVTYMCGVPSIEANFGNDKDKPFQYDINNCPGMGLGCI